ncbi:unnamed protein product [Tetraodon nigroviridis]|uniref:(spotted green pufferfish) hypothetical protein n=1 Tax=Tetraodon nigroviridis TaxID=99883 RepID=Q4SNB9_TETNG|nr:unnamed protein product [Tetraodon nigroviridis]
MVAGVRKRRWESDRSDGSCVWRLFTGLTGAGGKHEAAQVCWLPSTQTTHVALSQIDSGTFKMSVAGAAQNVLNSKIDITFFFFLRTRTLRL